MTIFARKFSKRTRLAMAGALLCGLGGAPVAAQDTAPAAPAPDWLSAARAASTTAAVAHALAHAEGTEEAQPGASPTGFLESTEIFGLVDAYYDWFSTRPGLDAQLRNFDTRHNQFSLSLLEIGFAKVPAADSRAGFRLDLDYGPTTALVHGAEPGGLTVFQNIQQAFMSYLAPVGKGLQIDVGKFVTQHGAEVIEAKDNWNYSRSILFAWAIPYYHTGVRASYAANDKVTIAGALVNGWNNVVENNEGKTVGVQLVLKPTTRLTLVQNYMGGPEQADNDDDWRQLADTTLTFAATDALSLMVNYDYGRDTLAGQSVHWQGIGAYARYAINDRCALIPRVEWYDDKDGYTTGTPQTLKEFTLTGEATLAPRLIWRVEYRGDFSDTAFFTKHDGTMGDKQHSVAFGLLYSFSSKTP